MDKITITVMFLGALIFFAHFFNAIFDRTKIPNVLLLMIMGIIAGFFIDKDLFFGEIGRVFTTITLVVILFESGTSLRFTELKSAAASATIITIYNYIITIAIVGFLINFFTPLNLLESLFLGGIVGGTSAAVVIPMLNQLKLKQKASTILLLESAFSDVLCLVVGLAILEAMKAGELELSTIFNSIWQSFLFAAAIGLVGGVVWSLFLNMIRGLKNSMFTTLAFVFLLYGMVELAGYNGGIAALCFGIVLGNAKAVGNSWAWKKIFRFEAAEFTPNEQNFFSEIVFIFQTYFFVYVGIVIEFGSPGTYLLATLILALTLFMRPIGIRLFVSKKVGVREITTMSNMAPKGLVPAVMASIPLQIGMASGQTIAEIGYAIVLLSIIYASVLVAVVSKDPLIYNKLYRRIFLSEAKKSRAHELRSAIKENQEDEEAHKNPEYENEEEVVIKVKKKNGKSDKKDPDKFED